MILQATAAGSIIVLLVNLLIGTVAIYAGARLVIDADTGVGRAAVTALLGALAWALVSFFVGWIPLLGPLLTLLAWIGIINWQYPDGWGSAAGIGLVAWLISVAALVVLSSVGLVGIEALGVPA
ncbi:hypothetical protein [Halohasta salina]|uniref:hypothetical protein n=1 Tax=Halohasta salina TaxID=2961621 RepID=UPI0020A29378|nr:hypothetical protein [Halohasta salina]